MKKHSCQSEIRRLPSSIDTRRVESVREDFAVHARSYFPVLSGDVSIRIEDVKRSSTNALIRFALSDGCTTARVIAKWAPVYPENNEGLTEFAHYRLFNSRYGYESAFGCPIPLCFFESENVLLTEEQDGLPLRDVCRSVLHRGSFKRVLHATILSGRWLCAFHHLTSPIKLPLHSAWGLVEKWSPWILERYLAKTELASVMTTRMRNKIGHCRRLLASCSCICNIGAIHGDFGPGNILVSSKKVTVLDAASNELGPQLIDVADFLGYMHLLSTVSLRKTRSCGTFINEFLKAYLGPEELQSAEKALLNLLMIGTIARTLERHLSAIRLMVAPLRALAASYCAHRYRNVLGPIVAKVSNYLGEIEAPVGVRNKRSARAYGGSRMMQGCVANMIFRWLRCRSETLERPQIKAIN